MSCAHAKEMHLRIGSSGRLEVIDDEWYTNRGSSYRDAVPGEARIGTRNIDVSGTDTPVLLFSGTARRPGGAIRFFAIIRRSREDGGGDTLRARPA